VLLEARAGTAPRCATWCWRPRVAEAGLPCAKLVLVVTHGGGRRRASERDRDRAAPGAGPLRPAWAAAASQRPSGDGVLGECVGTSGRDGPGSEQGNPKQRGPSTPLETSMPLTSPQCCCLGFCTAAGRRPRPGGGWEELEINSNRCNRLDRADLHDTGRVWLRAGHCGGSQRQGRAGLKSCGSGQQWRQSSPGLPALRRLRGPISALGDQLRPDWSEAMAVCEQWQANGATPLRA